MAQIQVMKTAYDLITPEAWQEAFEQFNIPVQLGVPADLDVEGVPYVVFDDPRLTEDQALAVMAVIGG